MCRLKFFILGCLASFSAGASGILIPMDASQRNHLKAYGIVYFMLQKEVAVDWLLNYRGGSFLVNESPAAVSECRIRGVSFETLSEVAENEILKEIASPAVNMNVVRLEKAPRVVVYSPKSDLISDESDAVISVLDYARIPYTLVYDEQILSDSLSHFDWLHLHHEDFTGQHGRWLRRESEVMQARLSEISAHQHGYSKVSEMKLDVARKIRAYCSGGGYLFAMCSAAETLDIALAADGVDINESEYDGDDMDPDAQQKLDFSKTLAFENFTLEPPSARRFSDINTAQGRSNFYEETRTFFRLFPFSAKWDIVPSMLTQNHEQVLKEFFGQTSAFNGYTIKPQVQILGKSREENKVRYIYDDYGKGHWTFYSGHDPEGSPGPNRTTNLDLFPNSPGYRLILNNVLFPSARKKKQKT